MIRIGPVAFNWQFLLVTLFFVYVSFKNGSLWPIIGWSAFLGIGFVVSIRLGARRPRLVNKEDKEAIKRLGICGEEHGAVV